jgi:hypothetical protein
MDGHLPNVTKRRPLTPAFDAIQAHPRFQFLQNRFNCIGYNFKIYFIWKQIENRMLGRVYGKMKEETAEGFYSYTLSSFIICTLLLIIRIIKKWG